MNNNETIYHSLKWTNYNEASQVWGFGFFSIFLEKNPSHSRNAAKMKKSSMYYYISTLHSRTKTSVQKSVKKLSYLILLEGQKILSMENFSLCKSLQPWPKQ